MVMVDLAFGDDFFKPGRSCDDLRTIKSDIKVTHRSSIGSRMQALFMVPRIDSKLMSLRKTMIEKKATLMLLSKSDITTTKLPAGMLVTESQKWNAETIQFSMKTYEHLLKY